MSLVEVKPVARHPRDLPCVEWHVVFCPSLSNLTSLLPWPLRLIAWRLDPAYRHCFALRPGELGTIMLNCVGQQLMLDWIPWAPHIVAAGCVQQGWKALRLPPRPFTRYRLRGVLSCVSVVKAAIGLHGAMVLTPRQLYRNLLRSGAHIVTR